jgi:hypothetical protein
MTQGAVLLHHSICSAELPNLNPIRLGFKAWRIIANITVKRPGTAEKGYALQVDLMNG